jgi:methionyl-tRNA formyltransferase
MNIASALRPIGPSTVGLAKLVKLPRKFLDTHPSTIFHRRAVSNVGSSLPDHNSSPKRIVFLGTPAVAAKCLEILSGKSPSCPTPYKIIGVVTQPPAPSGRNKKISKSPVHELALSLNIPVHTPELAKDESFLQAMESSGADLFITAAYGNYLPKRFLGIAPFGTINIHPSLLPKYRGAAPVQRCLENGDSETGVTLLYSVSKMDAGPIISQVKYPLTGNENSSKVLDDCFEIGINKLIQQFPALFDGKLTASIQNEELATAAPKLNASEGLLDFAAMSAQQIHNKCRAFSEWPGTYAHFDILGSIQRVKIISTCVLEKSSQSINADFFVAKGKLDKTEILQIRCGDGSVLGILSIQPTGKKVMDARSFINGMRGKIEMKWVPVGAVSDSIPASQ